MSALATLATTTLAAPVSSSDSSVSLASVSDVVAGQFLYCEQELMKVISVDYGGLTARVTRGAHGTAGKAHTSLAVVTIGRGDQFYDTNPFGAPPIVQLVSPWINVLTGEQWTAQGDENPLGPNLYWARTQWVHQPAGLGARTVASEVSSITTV